MSSHCWFSRYCICLVIKPQWVCLSKMLRGCTNVFNAKIKICFSTLKLWVETTEKVETTLFRWDDTPKIKDILGKGWDVFPGRAVKQTQQVHLVALGHLQCQHLASDQHAWTFQSAKHLWATWSFFLRREYVQRPQHQLGPSRADFRAVHRHGNWRRDYHWPFKCWTSRRTRACNQEVIWVTGRTEYEVGKRKLRKTQRTESEDQVKWRTNLRTPAPIIFAFFCTTCNVLLGWNQQSTMFRSIPLYFADTGFLGALPSSD